MSASFVDGLADAIVRQLLADRGGEILAAASPRGARVGRGRDAFADLDRRGIARVASAIAGQLKQAQNRELPLEAIEI